MLRVSALLAEEKRACLIVEDETLIAMLIEEAVSDMGLAVMGPVSRISRALQLLENESPACAVLDINVAGEPIHPVAQLLAERGVPFLFVSGYGDAGLGRDLPKRRVVEKPFAVPQLQAAIRKLLEEGISRA